MNLAACGAARQREDFVMRLGCFLVTFAVLASLVLLPPKAKAFAMTSSAVTALAGGFLSACGLTPVVSGMNNSGEVNESLARLIQEYLDAEIPGADLISWLGSRIPMRVASGNRLIIPMSVAGALREFAVWVAGKYGTKPGVNQVYHVADSHVVLQDGRVLYFSTMEGVGNINSTVSAVGSVFNSGTDFPVVFSTGYYYGLDPASASFGTAFFTPEGKYINGNRFSSARDFTFSLNNAGRLCVFWLNNKGVFEYCCGVSIVNPDAAFGEYCPIGNIWSADESLSLDVSDTMQQVLDRLTALEEGQSIALDVGATQSMEIQEILQGILDAILAGDLAASAEIVDEAVEPEEPDPPVVPVVPSGLDKLGAALTSRFPFSIPWDVYRGVTLLAAPPKAPYFEVDFMAPIADRVGGWKGSTKIVLDFSEYEIIGQVCRWTSTIGFCLMLASGTKRLIWTA